MIELSSDKAVLRGEVSPAMESFLAFSQGKLKTKSHFKKLKHLLNLHSVEVTFVRNEREKNIDEEAIVAKIEELFARIDLPITRVSERWTNERGLSTPASLLESAMKSPPLIQFVPMTAEEQMVWYRRQPRPLRFFILEDARESLLSTEHNVIVIGSDLELLIEAFLAVLGLEQPKALDSDVRINVTAIARQLQVMRTLEHIEDF